MSSQGLLMALLPPGMVGAASEGFIQPEKTKNRTERIVSNSSATSELFSRYLLIRRQLNRERGAVFLSKSYRNHGQPISIWTWSKAIARCSLGRKCAKFSGSVCELLVLVRLGVSTPQKFSGRKRVRGSSGQMVHGTPAPSM
jgi:hypothetical protein